MSTFHSAIGALIALRISSRTKYGNNNKNNIKKELKGDLDMSALYNIYILELRRDVNKQIDLFFKETVDKNVLANFKFLFFEFVKSINVENMIEKFFFSINSFLFKEDFENWNFLHLFDDTEIVENGSIKQEFKDKIIANNKNNNVEANIVLLNNIISDYL